MHKFKTSGTTGERKTFMMSDELMQARADRFDTIKSAELSGATGILVCVSPVTVVAQQYAKWAGDRNIPCTFVEGSVDSAVAHILDAHPSVIIGSPGYLAGLSERLNGRYQFQAIISSGSTILPEQLRVITRMGNHVISSYGSSETGSISIATTEHLALQKGCVGVPHADVEVRISAGGEVQVKTPVMISEYVERQHTATKFVDGWFRTGDRGYLSEGLLFLMGRMDKIARQK